MPKHIFEDAEDSSYDLNNHESIININGKYAKSYEEKKRREELQLLEEKYSLKPKNSVKASGEAFEEDTEDSDDESEEDEDDIGELITPELDAQILKTLSSIRAKDKSIYDINKKFFTDEEVSKPNPHLHSKDSQRPLSLKAYHSKLLLEGFNPDEEEEYGEPETVQPTFTEEQMKLKASFKAAVFDRDDDDDNEDNDEEDSLLVKKSKNKVQLQKEEDEYQQFLLQVLESDSIAQTSMNKWIEYGKTMRTSSSGKHKMDSDPSTNLSSEKPTDEDFLIKYILSRGWIDKSKKLQLVVPEADLFSEDEEHLEQTEEFETSYNFRFEQDGGTQLVSHPRHLDGLIRREDQSRKQKRKEIQSKKQSQKLKETEELKRLKNLKKQEIHEKRQVIAKVAGIDPNMPLKISDFEDDFDPSKFDEAMSRIFNEQYYDENVEENEKEMFDTREIQQLIGSFSEEEEEEVSIQRRNEKDNVGSNDMKKKGPNKASLHRPDGVQPDLARLEDEYYKLHYEDKIEGLSTRFRYHPVVPSAFGLNIKEIIDAGDKSLNQYVSLRKLAPYKDETDQVSDIQKYFTRKRLHKFQRKWKHESDMSQKKHNKDQDSSNK